MAQAPEKRKNDIEAQRLKKEEKARATRRRNRQIIGFALSILVVAGAVSIVLFAVNLVRGMMDTTDEFESYQDLLQPMVWFDVLPFASVEALDENAVKEVCLWGVLSSTDESNVRRTDMGEALIPVIEMERYAVSLFGNNFRFSGHEEFRNALWGLYYGYDAETQMYILPPTSLDAPFLPSVVDIEDESGGVRRVVMGYVSTRTSDNRVVPEPDYAHPAYYMDYMFRRDGNNYYLYAMQPNTTYAAEVAASATPAQSVPEEEPVVSVLPEDESEQSVA